jgi:hypothetical protein
MESCQPIRRLKDKKKKNLRTTAYVLSATDCCSCIAVSGCTIIIIIVVVVSVVVVVVVLITVLRLGA